MTFLEFVHWAEEQGIPLLLSQPDGETGHDEPAEDGEPGSDREDLTAEDLKLAEQMTGAIFDELQTAWFGAHYEQALFLGLSHDKYRTVTAVWVVGDTGAGCRVHRIFCSKFPDSAFGHCQVEQQMEEELTYEKLREMLVERTSTGYRYVGLPAFVPVVIGMNLN